MTLPRPLPEAAPLPPLPAVDPLPPDDPLPAVGVLVESSTGAACFWDIVSMLYIL